MTEVVHSKTQDPASGVVSFDSLPKAPGGFVFLGLNEEDDSLYRHFDSFESLRVAMKGCSGFCIIGTETDHILSRVSVLTEFIETWQIEMVVQSTTAPDSLETRRNNRAIKSLEIICSACQRTLQGVWKVERGDSGTGVLVLRGLEH